MKGGNPALAVVIVLGLFLLITSAFYPLGFLSVLDAKRVLQLGGLAALSVFALTWAPLRNATCMQMGRVTGLDTLALGLFVVIGVVSALRLQHPAYSLLDVSMILVMLLLIFITAASRTLAGTSFDRWGVLLLAAMGFAVFVQESMGMVVGWVTGDEFSYQQALVHFAHPRFFNHLQTLSIPVLAALPLLFPGRRGIVAICIVLLGFQWYLVIFTAARGTTVGLVTAMVFIALWLPEQRRFWLRYQFAGLLVAALLYAGALFLNTTLIPQSGSFYANSVGRPMMHTSGRSVFWRVALEDGLKNPATGAGPGRYACEIKRFMPAHPHSFLFRIIGEWGFIAFFLVVFVAGRVVVRLLKQLKSLNSTGQTGPPLRAMLATSLIAGVIHACLSGVLIMPAGQALMVLIGGWTLGLTVSPNTPRPGTSRYLTAGNRILLVAGVLLALMQFVFATYEIPRLHERTIYAGTYGPMAPRFWQDGKVCKYAY